MIKKTLFYTVIFLSILFMVYYVSNASKIKTSNTLYATLSIEKNEITTNAFPLVSIEEVEHSYDFVPNAHIDFLSRNSDYMGWLTLEGTSIDYPVVRGNDNTHYLTHDFDNKPSQIGSIFMDYRNIGHFNDWQTVIYGHYVKSGDMFHNLHLYKDEGFFKNNHTLTFASLYEEKRFKIFSVYTVIADDHVIDVHVETDNRLEHLRALKEASMHLNDEHIDASYSIITLVTCTYETDNARIILHAYEIP